MALSRFNGVRTVRRQVGTNIISEIQAVGNMEIDGDLTVNGNIVSEEVGSSVIETAATNTATEELMLFNVKSTGTPAAGFGGRVNFKAETTTTEDVNQAAIEVKWGVASHATREGSIALKAYYTSTLQTGVEVRGGSAGVKLGFNGATPVVKPGAYTQTYATATRTLAAYVADTETVAYTGLATDEVGTPYASVADLNALRVAYENLRALVENTTQLLNSVIDDAQAYGLLA